MVMMIIADHPIDVTADPSVPPRSDDYLHYGPARMTAPLYLFPPEIASSIGVVIYQQSPSLYQIAARMLPNR